MDNPLPNATPDQKLAILRNEILTPLAIIQGCAAILQKHFEREAPKSADLIECIEGISKSSAKIKNC
ncbi:MAG TPA: hypothetical protein VK900_06450 [Anaerolineales bacterium]|nr:hypothetical protein [Anaerolineales bacterium]